MEGRKIIRSVRAITERARDFCGTAILFAVKDVNGNSFTSAKRLVSEDGSNTGEIVNEAVEYFKGLGFIDITTDQLNGCSW